VYCFNESRETFMHRCRGLKLPIADHVAQGRVDLRQYSVGGLTPGQFLHDLREDVEHRGAKLVVIDSFTGYLNLMPHEQHLTNKLHEIIRFLSSRNVLTLVTVNLHSPFGTAEAETPTSYLADSVVLMRHFEGLGSVRRCIAMLKKRHGAHERTIREVDLGEGGVRLGPPLKDFTGLLTGSPQYLGRRENLLTKESDESERRR
jgi:circadian clock protein KaiC